MMSAGPLPETDSYVELSLLDGGSFIGDTDKVHAGVANVKFRMYNWAFCISHGDGERIILWDLGLHDDRSLYTPYVDQFILSYINPVGPRRSIVEQLNVRGVSASQIGTVLFSHAHWDHCRPIRREFANATAYFGPGTKEGCTPGHIKDKRSQWDGRFFDPEQSTERWEELAGPWKPFGPFDKAMDFFGDGSFWVIQAPGHMSGNLCAAAKLNNGEWVLLASDCCHTRALLNGTHDIAQFYIPGRGSISLHADIPAAKDTLERIRVLQKEYGFHIALAHDAVWMKEGSDDVLMGLLDEQMRCAAKERILKDKPV